ncbi:MAG: alpha-amylase family glycosyl hydrolase [Opitutales bacterium]
MHPLFKVGIHWLDVTCKAGGIPGLLRFLFMRCISGPGNTIKKKIAHFLTLSLQMNSLLISVKWVFSHVEFLPPSEYPYGASWGYQVTGYYAPTYRYGTPEEFAVLIQRLKEKKIKVLIDWVPAHFPADDFSLSRFDGTCLFEHEDSEARQAR